LGKRVKVAAVFALAKLFCQAQKPLAVDVAHVIGDLLDAGDLNWNGPGRLAGSGLGLGAALPARRSSQAFAEGSRGNLSHGRTALKKQGRLSSPGHIARSGQIVENHAHGRVRHRIP
jgi:hypothetical protein